MGGQAAETYWVLFTVIVYSGWYLRGDGPLMAALWGPLPRRRPFSDLSNYSVWFVKNEYLMAKINVYRSLLPSDRVIGWDMKMTSHPNSNTSFINIWDRLIWRRSPNLTRSSKLAAAPNWSHGLHAAAEKFCPSRWGRSQSATNFFCLISRTHRTAMAPMWPLLLKRYQSKTSHVTSHAEYGKIPHMTAPLNS